MNMNIIVDLCEEKPTDELILQVYLNKKNGVKTNYFYRKFQIDIKILKII